MNRKLILFNVVLITLFFVPTVLYKNSYYKCTAGLYGKTNKVKWTSKASNFKRASALAIAACKDNSGRPEGCDILMCGNYFF